MRTVRLAVGIPRGGPFCRPGYPARRPSRERAAGLFRRGGFGKPVPPLHRAVVPHQKPVFKPVQAETVGVLQQVRQNLIVTVETAVKRVQVDLDGDPPLHLAELERIGYRSMSRCTAWVRKSRRQL